MNPLIVLVATDIRFAIPVCFVLFYIWMWLTAKKGSVTNDYIFKNSLLFSLVVGGIVYLNTSHAVTTIDEFLDVNPADF